MPSLRKAEIGLVALSTDDAEHAAAFASEHGLSFPVGYALDLVDTATRLGTYYEEKRGILHASGFLLRPDGAVSVACYSSGAIGRLEPDSVSRLVAFYQDRIR